MSVRRPSSALVIVVALDLDNCSLIGNDTDGLRNVIDAYHTLDDVTALALMARLINPRLLETIQSKNHTFVFYTAKYMIARGLKAVVEPPASVAWLTPHTIRLSGGPSSRTYLYDQIPHPDLLGLGLVTWALSRLLGLKDRSAPVYIADEHKNPALLARDLQVPRVILFDDQADAYAHTLGSARDMRSVTPYTFACLTPQQAHELELFLNAHCPVVHPNEAPTLYAHHRWRLVEQAQGLPLPPWPSIKDVARADDKKDGNT